MNKEKRIVNSIANIGSRLWSMFATLIFLPLYLLYLGEEAYGLVTLYATLQVAMNLLGLGLSSTLRREFSVGENIDDNKNYKRKLLTSVELVYIFAGIISIVILYFSSTFIATKWLAENSLFPTVVSNAITLMGISIGIQMMNNLWHGCLLGLNHQVRANLFDISFSILKHVLALLASIYFESIIYYYYSFIIIELIYAFTLRISLAIKLKSEKKDNWKFRDFKLIKKVWRYASGIMVISLISLLLTQIDKVILSRFLNLREIGAYNSIFTLGSLSRVLSTGVSITVLTEFTQLYSKGSHDTLEMNYLKIWKLVSTITLITVTFIIFFSGTIMRVWTNNEFYAESATHIAPFLLAGIGAVALQEIPYSYLLSKGKTNLNVYLGLLVLPIYAVLVYFGTVWYGVVGTSIVYAVVFILHTILFFLFANKDINNRKELVKVYLSLFYSLIYSLGIAFTIKFISSKITNQYIVLLMAVISGIITVITFTIINTAKADKNYYMIGLTKKVEEI